jgi:hypothetical protein
MINIVSSLTELAVAEIMEQVFLSPYTRYRGQLVDRVEKLHRELDVARRVTAPPLTPRKRALLVMVKRPIHEEADRAEVAEYVGAVALGAPLEELATKVQKTLAPELMRRFELVVPPEHRVAVKVTRVMAEVMLS